jgi:hypothetical protein
MSKVRAPWISATQARFVKASLTVCFFLLASGTTPASPCRCLPPPKRVVGPPPPCLHALLDPPVPRASRCHHRRGDPACFPPSPARYGVFLPAVAPNRCRGDAKFLFSSRRLVVQALLGFRLESPTRLSGQVGRLAGDLIFPVD